MKRALDRVLVVGGGPAGSAAALELRDAGAEVTLVERGETAVDRAGETLAGEGVQILRELGVLSAFERLETRRSYLHRIRWGGRVSERPALAVAAGPNHHLDRARFDAMLLDACGQRGVDVRRGSVVRLEAEPCGLVVAVQTAAGPQQLACDAVIDATGRAASVARQLGARRERADHLVALTATFERGETEPSSLLESALEGWWYTAPRPSGGLIAMYLTEGSGPGLRDHERVWQQALAVAPTTRARLLGRARRTEIAVCAAAPGFTHFDAELPVLPVGDAAVSFDPLSGEGLCFALRSGIEAARALGSEPLRRAFYDGALGVYRAHLQKRERSYARERPWRSSPFWQRPRDVVGAERLNTC